VEASCIGLFLLCRCGILRGVPLPVLQMLQLVPAARGHRDFSSKFVKFSRLSVKAEPYSEVSCAGGCFFLAGQLVAGCMLLYMPWGISVLPSVR